MCLDRAGVYSVQFRHVAIDAMVVCALEIGARSDFNMVWVVVYELGLIFNFPEVHRMLHLHPDFIVVTLCLRQLGTQKFVHLVL